ncbi:MAG: alkylation response protein AidB-like acyl-CoA dehydrogenase [Methylophilaceae bacterium]|jgi:alkylation response protein AidB-like acyl-CoA dehydrogenase
MQSQELSSLFSKAQKIAREVVAPTVDFDFENVTWPEEGIRALQKEGFGGLVVPTLYGGLGSGVLTLAKVCEILGQECASTAICFGMHCVGSSVIAANPTEAQQIDLLKPICDGNHITTLSLSEAGTGSSFYLPQATMKNLSAEEFCINGSKTFVTNGKHADSYVVSVVSDNTQEELGLFSCAVVPGSSDGIEWGPEWAGMGMRGNSSRTMDLHNVRVPKNNLLGKQGDQIWYIFNVVMPYFLMAMAGTYIGVASTAIEEAKNHLSRRYHAHTGASLAQNSILQHRLGTLWASLEASRQLTYHAAASFDSGEPEALIALMSAKVQVADMVVNIVNESMTLCGGIGYRKDSKLHLLLRDARAAPLMAPTSDIMRVWLGRALLGQPLLAD